MAQGIYTADGNFIEFADPFQGLTTEVATRQTVGELDISSYLSWLPDPDPVLRKRGDDASVLGDLTADDQVYTAMQNRKQRVLNNRDYDFKPGVRPGQEASRQAVELCDQLTHDLEGIKLINVFNAVLDAPFYGSSFLELIWEAQDGRYRLADIKAKPRAWFVFNADGVACLKGPINIDAQPLPRFKFLVPRHFPTYENPYGLRLLSRCLWPVAFKRGGIQFFTRFLDRFGQPWTLGKAPQGSTQADKQNMAADLAAMVQDAVAVIPHGSEVTLVESKGTAGAHFELYLKRWDKAILKVIGGQTLTSEMDGQGSRAAAQVHMGVADDLAEADQYLVECTMNDLALIYRDINAPQVEAPVFGYHEPEDYNAQADLDAKLFKSGVRFTPAHFERRYGLNPAEFTVDGQGQAGQEEPPAGKEFAEGGPDNQDLLDRLIDSILPQAAASNGEFVARLLELIQRAESFEDIQLLLAEHLGPELDQSQQEDLLADLLAASALMGRAAAREEADGA